MHIIVNMEKFIYVIYNIYIYIYIYIYMYFIGIFVYVYVYIPACKHFNRHKNPLS